MRKFVYVILSVILLIIFLSFSQSSAQKEGNKKYVGSESCETCHEEHYKGWKSTLHSKMEQDPIKDEPNKNVLGDFSTQDFHLTFNLEDVDMLVGSRFKQRYAKRIGDDYYMLPAQWNVETKEWVTYQPKNDWWAAEGVYPK